MLHGRAHVAVPDDAAIGRVERIDVVGFGDGDNHCPAARAALEVEGLGVNVAADAAVERQIAVESGSRRGREGGVNIETIARGVVMVLGDVDSLPG